MVKSNSQVPPYIRPVDLPQDREITRAVLQGSPTFQEFEQQRFNDAEAQKKREYNDQLFYIAQHAEAQHIATILNFMVQGWEKQQTEEAQRAQERHAEPSKEAEKASATTSQELRTIQGQDQRELEKMARLNALTEEYNRISKHYAQALTEAQNTLDKLKPTWQAAIENAKKDIFSSQESLKNPPHSEKLTTEKLKDAAAKKLKSMPKDIRRLQEKLKEKEAKFKSQKEHLTHLTEQLDIHLTKQLDTELRTSGISAKSFAEKLFEFKKGKMEGKNAALSGVSFKVEMLMKTREMALRQYLTDQLRLKKEIEGLQGDLNKLSEQQDKLERFMDPQQQEGIMKELNSNLKLNEKFAAFRAALMQEKPQSSYETLLQGNPTRSDQALHECYERQRDEGASLSQAFNAVNRISTVSGVFGDSLLVASRMKEYFIELDKQMIETTGLSLKEVLGLGPVQLAADYANNQQVQKAICDYHERLNHAETANTELTTRTADVCELRYKQKLALDELLGHMQNIMGKSKEDLAKDLRAGLSEPKPEAELGRGQRMT